MKTQRFRRYPVLLLALLALAGCKVMDESVDEETAGDTSEGSIEDPAGGDATDDNTPPAIWGDPATDVLAGTQYLFIPEAEDSDGDTLEFSLANKPAWAEFDGGSGELRGIPETGDEGLYENLVLSVTDGESVVSLPSFDIRVDAAPRQEEDEDEGSGTSSPPSIWGTPNTHVVAETLYSFQPEASDPDGDKLSFSVTNKPSWAAFDTTTGLLEGRPGHEHVGTSRRIEISVTDGSSVAALERFRITVESAGTTAFTLSWIPPTENADGSPLTDLAGYRIYYGSSSGNYSEVVELTSAGMTSYVLDDLAPGIWYLAMTSFNSHGLESDKTPEFEFQTGT